MRLQRRGGRQLILTPEGAAVPTRKPSRDAGQGAGSSASLAAQNRERSREVDHRSRGTEGVTDAYVCRLLPLTCLAPDIVEALLDGRQPKGLRLAEVLGNAPLAWKEQRDLWGFSRKP